MSKPFKDTEKTEWLIARIFFGLIAVLILLFGFCFNPKGGDEFGIEFLYTALHPMSVLNCIGVIFLFIFLFYLSGLWVKIIGEQSIPAGSSWPNIAGFACGLIGGIFIFA